MQHWTLDDIKWHEFDATKVKPELVSLAKAACMVEHNGSDYARYLKEVFHQDPEFQKLADAWALEEIQHGQVLRKWAELADPSFNFEASFKAFTSGVTLPKNVDGSIRGSCSGELISRCVVEAGTSAYYTMLKEHGDEPVFKSICARIAADELRHYKLFYTNLKTYLAREKLSGLKRLLISFSRVSESEDDELAYAYYAAHRDQYKEYDHKFFKNLCFATLLEVYKQEHYEKMVAMIIKAIGFKPRERVTKVIAHMGHNYIKFSAYKYRRSLKLRDAA